MKKKLGRGLGALIPQAETPKRAAEHGIASVDLDNIKPNPYQPRKEFSPEKFVELVESIKEKGVLEPVLLRRTPGKFGDDYELISGERRFRAAKEAGLTDIPAIVKDVGDKEMLEIALIENLQREDLNAIEEAEGYRALMEKFSYTQEELAKKISRERVTVANTLRLLKLPAEIKNYISKGLLSEGHGRAILSLEKQPMQLILADVAVKKGLSVRATEEAAKKMSPSADKKPASQKDVHVANLEEELTEIFGTKVKIKHRGKGGRIEIDYYSSEEFQRILESVRKL